MPPMQPNCLHALISGEVQGVGYRWYTRRHALALGLAGYVRNLSDGRVEVRAQGPRDTLERFLAALWRGPEGAAVRDVAVEWEEARERFAEFAIR